MDLLDFLKIYGHKDNGCISYKLERKIKRSLSLSDNLNEDFKEDSRLRIYNIALGKDSFGGVISHTTVIFLEDELILIADEKNPIKFKDKESVEKFRKFLLEYVSEPYLEFIEE